MAERPHARRILCVDDEPNVLAGLRRTLFDRFEVHTAGGGAEGLEVLRERGPFAVVVSDMRMPEMDGAAFLERVRAEYPDVVRVLLTGYADMTSAIAAVNRGNIFRFLSKPCPTDDLLGALDDAVEQYRLRRVERDLLEETVAGAVSVMTDVLGLAAPVAFARAGAVRGLVAHMAARLGLDDPWQYEVSARLSQLGCITLAPDTLERVYAGQPLDKAEEEALARHPEIGARLLARIPRLETVAEMVGGQMDPSRCGEGPARRGAEMLRLALAVDGAMATGAALREALGEARRSGHHPEELLDALDDFEASVERTTLRSVSLAGLRSFMVLEEDVRSLSGQVVVARGRELNLALIERLKNFARRKGVTEPIRVRVPASMAEVEDRAAAEAPAAA